MTRINEQRTLALWPLTHSESRIAKWDWSKQPPIASAPPLIRYLWMEYSRMTEAVSVLKYRGPEGEVPISQSVLWI